LGEKVEQVKNRTRAEPSSLKLYCDVIYVLAK
jgi:hypothetical protein